MNSKKCYNNNEEKLSDYTERRLSCDTGRELDCPWHSICNYNTDRRIIRQFKFSDLNATLNIWDYENKKYVCIEKEEKISGLEFF